ncbi:MAG TPA: hypothetical protein VI756_33220 [Blastocatellia bacterium]
MKETSRPCTKRFLTRGSGAITLCLAVVIVALATGPACTHKPSYADIKINQSGGLATENNNAVAGALTAANAASGAGGQSGSVNAHPEPIPSFFDQKTGQIKDLPLIPHSKITALQYGPYGTYTSMSMQAKTAVPFDKVTEFYDEAVKSGGWKVISNDRDGDAFIWRLAKGNEGATVQVSKSFEPNITYVGLNRMTPRPDASPIPGASSSPGATPSPSH